MKTPPKPAAPRAVKLNAKQVRYLRAQRGKKTQRALAAELGVAPATVFDVQAGRTWKPAVKAGVTPSVTAP